MVSFFGFLAGGYCYCNNQNFLDVGGRLRCINCLKSRNPSTPLTPENFNRLEDIDEKEEIHEQAEASTYKRHELLRKGSLARELESDLIAATNRTTHAVRAFVLFLFYQLSAITTATVLYFLAGVIGNRSEECEPVLRQYGACEPQPFLLFLALIIWISGVFYSSKVGWEEIRKSEV